jgi:hypothetical protein
MDGVRGHLRGWLSGNLKLVTMSAVSALAASAAVAIATVPDSGGVIHSCYKIAPGANECATAVGHVKLSAALQFDACVIRQVKIGARSAAVGGPSGPSTQFEVTKLTDGVSAKLSSRIWRSATPRSSGSRPDRAKTSRLTNWRSPRFPKKAPSG